jgi:hypothetical protein
VGSTAENAKHLKYCEVLEGAARKIGRDMRTPARFEELLTRAGFVNIHFYRLQFPIGPWPKGEKNKLLGKLVAKNLNEGVRTASFVIARVLGWESDKLETLVKEAQDEYLDPKYPHATYVEACYAYAQKPE